MKQELLTKDEKLILEVCKNTRQILAMFGDDISKFDFVSMLYANENLVAMKAPDIRRILGEYRYEIEASVKNPREEKVILQEMEDAMLYGELEQLNILQAEYIRLLNSNKRSLKTL